MNDIPVRLHIAAFVKTPGLSPVKTRLAAGVGEAAALTFFNLACAATQAVLKETERLAPGGIVAHWAVAEAAGLAQWASLRVLAQGEGGLGARLDHVYRALAGPGVAPVLIGADAPQITAATFLDVRAAFAAGHDFVLGPATDGGFYLFAGARPIPTEVWTEVSYSVATTADELARRLAPWGRLAWLAPLTDVDQTVDLPALLAQLAQLTAPLPAQQELAAWIKARLKAGLASSGP